MVSQQPYNMEALELARGKKHLLCSLPNDGLSSPFTWARQQLPGTISLPMQNARDWGHYMSSRMEKPCRCRAGTESSHLHISQKAGNGSLPHGLAHKQVWLAMCSQKLGDESSQSCHHPFFHSLGREERGKGDCPPHRYMVRLADLSRRDTSASLFHLGPTSKPELPFLCPFQLIMIVTWVLWETNLPEHVGSAGGSEDAKWKGLKHIGLGLAGNFSSPILTGSTDKHIQE